MRYGGQVPIGQRNRKANCEVDETQWEEKTVRGHFAVNGLERKEKQVACTQFCPHVQFAVFAQKLQIIIILARTPEIGQGLGRILSCGARKPEQT